LLAELTRKGGLKKGSRGKKYYFFFKMKGLKIITICGLVTAMFFTSCEGPAGPAGAVGPAGAPGAVGATGPAGKNTTVIQVSYGAKTHTGSKDLFLTFPNTFTAEFIDKSLFYTYIKKKVKATDGKEYDYWFSVPGETNTGNEYSNYFFVGGQGVSAGMYLRRVVNYINGDEIFDAVRIIATPANETIVGGARKKSINYSDYNEVKRAYNLPK
jgi:hypothetical protein